MKFVALKEVGGPEMGRRERTSAEKIRDGAGAASSSLSGESAYTHQGAKDGAVGCVGRAMAKIPRWRLASDLDLAAPIAFMGATKRVCGLTLRQQLPLVAPLHGLLAM